MGAIFERRFRVGDRVIYHGRVFHLFLKVGTVAGYDEQWTLVQFDTEFGPPKMVDEEYLRAESAVPSWSEFSSTADPFAEFRLAHWSTAFRDYPVHEWPEYPLEGHDGFVDTSSANNPCPSVTSDELGLTVWIDYPDPAQRRNSSLPRYRVEPQDHGVETSGEPGLIYPQTDDWEEVQEFVTDRKFKIGEAAVAAMMKADNPGWRIEDSPSGDDFWALDLPDGRRLQLVDDEGGIGYELGGMFSVYLEGAERKDRWGRADRVDLDREEGVETLKAALAAAHELAAPFNSQSLGPILRAWLIDQGFPPADLSDIDPDGFNASQRRFLSAFHMLHDAQRTIDNERALPDDAPSTRELLAKAVLAIGALATALDANQSAWQGEEDTVQEEHADLIATNAEMITASARWIGRDA